MDIADVPFMTTDWTSVPETQKPGEAGMAYFRTVQAGNLRVRLARYSAGYRADHWCKRGHVLLVLKGELTTELQDGRVFVLKEGTSYQVASGAEPHRSRTEVGATLFIVD